MSETSLEQVLTRKREARQDIVNVDEPTVKLVIFALGDAWYAFRGEAIREILARADVYFLPGCPAALEGVINVRGDIESVLRLTDILHLPMADRESASSILLGRAAGLSSGIRVDRVVDVVDIPQSQLQAAPSTLPEHLRPLVSRVLRFQGQPVTVLDLEAVFTQLVRKLK